MLEYLHEAVSSVETDNAVNLVPEGRSAVGDPLETTGPAVSMMTVLPGDVALLPSGPVTVAVITWVPSGVALLSHEVLNGGELMMGPIGLPSRANCTLEIPAGSDAHATRVILWPLRCVSDAGDMIPAWGNI